MSTDDDLALLPELTEESIIKALDGRFSKDLIYSWVGSTLCSVNPYQQLAGLYTPERFAEYQRLAVGEQKAAHIFAVGANALGLIREQGCANQSVLISGESGAGKTEATKLILRFLGEATRARAVSGDLESALNAANPVLEAFGNAQTVRNNNSSRFGRFTKVFFSVDETQLLGANIETFLLERARVPSQGPLERNFHIFYQLLSGTEGELRSSLGLDCAKSFKYVGGSSNAQRDSSLFRETMDSMEALHFSKQEQQDILALVAAVLHLGNLTFKEKMGDASKGLVVEEPNESLDFAAKLMQVEKAELVAALTTEQLDTRKGGTMLHKHLTVPKAVAMRDALAKTLYSQTFDWLVARVNKSLGIQNSSKFIGLLDVFGFESFELNSFEQLCINYANEKLQALFIHFTLDLEQKKYQEEGVVWSPVNYSDNADTLALLDSSTGLFRTLDDTCRLGASAKPAQYIQKVTQQFSKHASFGLDRKLQDGFIVKHFAGDVGYTCTDFIEKNSDKISLNILMLCTESRSPFISGLLSNLLGGSQAKRKASVGATFRKQVTALYELLSSTNLHFVRCVKPNRSMAPSKFVNEDVAEQLKCAGLYELLEVRKKGYAVNRLKTDFEERYRCLMHSEGQTLSIQEALLEFGDDDEFVVGNTTVFLKSELASSIEKARAAALGVFATRISAAWRGYRCAQQYRSSRLAASCIQRSWRVCSSNARLRRLVVASLLCARVGEEARQEQRRLDMQRMQEQQMLDMQRMQEQQKLDMQSKLKEQQDALDAKRRQMQEQMQANKDRQGALKAQMQATQAKTDTLRRQHAEATLRHSGAASAPVSQPPADATDAGVELEDTMNYKKRTIRRAKKNQIKGGAVAPVAQGMLIPRVGGTLCDSFDQLPEQAKKKVASRVGYTGDDSFSELPGAWNVLLNVCNKRLKMDLYTTKLPPWQQSPGVYNLPMYCAEEKFSEIGDSLGTTTDLKTLAKQWKISSKPLFTGANSIVQRGTSTSDKNLKTVFKCCTLDDTRILREGTIMQLVGGGHPSVPRFLGLHVVTRIPSMQSAAAAKAITKLAKMAASKTKLVKKTNFDAPPQHWLQMDYVKGLTVDQAARLHKWSAPDLAFVAKSLFEGVAYLHKHNIVHRNIGSSNVVIDQSGQTTLLDFGSATLVRPPQLLLGLLGGSPFHCPPEMLRGLPHAFPADIWSAMCCLVQLANGRWQPLYGGSQRPTSVDATRVMFQVGCGVVPELLQANSSTQKSFVERALQVEQSARATAAQLLQDEYLVTAPSSVQLGKAYRTAQKQAFFAQ